MPERVLPIPGIKDSVDTPMEIGIRITNSTLKSLHFCFFSSLYPKLIAPDGQFLPRGCCTDGLRNPDKSDFMQVMQRQAVTFCFRTSLFWTINRKKKHDRQLIIGIVVDEYCRTYSARILMPGTYQVQFRYRETRDHVEQYYKEQCGIEPSILQEVWIGEVITPPVDFRLVLPQTEVVSQ